jgi:hypothetical protein
MILPRFTMPAANALAIAAALAGSTTTLAGVPAHGSLRAASVASGQKCVSDIVGRGATAGTFRVLSPDGNGSRGPLRQAGWRREAGLWVRPAGSPAAVPAPRQAGPAYTVTVTGTDISGRPAGGLDQVFLYNADNSAKFDNSATSVERFTNGAATFQVPAGHYWAVGDFHRLPSKQQNAEYLDVLPQFTVGGNTTVHLAASAATSPIEATVARPAVRQFVTFQLIRTAPAGRPVNLLWVRDGSPKTAQPTLYVSPTRASPSVGTLATVTGLQLGSAAATPGSRYLYDLAYQSTGTIPAQRHVVNQAALATVHPRYYSSIRSVGLSGTFPNLPVNQICQPGGALFSVMRFPARQTVYVLAGRQLSWGTQFIQNQAQDYSGGQTGPFQALLPGAQQTQDFGAYPLHPAPSVRLSNVPGLPPVPVSAGRAGNTLRLAMTAFSDSVPGHAGQGTFPPVQAAASYEIDQNGTKIAGGTVPKFTGPFSADAALSPAPSTIRFSLNAARPAKLDPLSNASHTVWTWRSAAVPGARLPAGWTCQPGVAAGRACAVQPMMTLRYGVVGLGQDGATAAGQQVVRVQVGHLQLTRATPVTAVAVSVSFDGGKTWQPAQVTGGNGSYAAVFTAPPGARVTLRTSASDTAGGSVTETIANAYQVAA